MSSAAPPRHTAFRCMTRFRCIRSVCEASCCAGGWEIEIDRQHYDATKKALGETRAGRREFDAKLRLVEEVTRSPERRLAPVPADGQRRIGAHGG